MYEEKQIKAILRRLKHNDYKITRTAKETGVKVRTLISWYEKQKKGIPVLIRPYIHYSNSKYTKTQKQKAISYYFSHGMCASSTCRILGYPKQSTLKYWLYHNKRFIKEKGYTPPIRIKKKKIQKNDKELIKENEKLKIKNDIFKYASKMLIKGIRCDFSNLNNKEKYLIVKKCEGSFSLKKLCENIGLSKQSYYYQNSVQNIDKYEEERKIIRSIFYDNYQCYGYRRIHEEMKKQHGITISEKVICRLMKEEKLFVYKHKSPKYNSYKGEISPEIPNLLKRQFFSDKPLSKLVTDITEFSLKNGKVYLSPLIDCFTGTPIIWKIGFSPNSTLTNNMLLELKKFKTEKNLIVHSDRGFHYRIDSWIKIMKDNGYTRSMSKKGCSPDNSACEGFFGLIKNEFYYSKDWNDTTKEEFAKELDKYLIWFITKRIKKRLDYLPPNVFIEKNK